MVMCDYCGRRYEKVAKVIWSDNRGQYNYYCNKCLEEVRYNARKLPWESEIVDVKYVRKREMPN